MTVTTDRVRRDEVAAHPGSRARSRALDDAIPAPVALGLLAAWLFGLIWLFAISPAPDPAAEPSGLDAVISTAMFGSWLAAFIGLGGRRRFGLVATIGGGLLLAGAGVLCGLTGHTGLWIPIQIGVGAGLSAAGVLAARLT